MVAASETPSNSLRVERSLEIVAPIDITFGALLEQLGPECETHSGTAMPMKLEPWPGGRWFRDLGNNAGHWWGTVQVIKPPTLVEINGPLFMSYPAISHIQYRLEDVDGKTKLSFVHRAIGEFDPSHIEGVREGWMHQIKSIKLRAEKTC